MDDEVKHGRRVGDWPIVTRLRRRLVSLRSRFARSFRWGNDWLSRSPLAAYLFVVIGLSFALYRIESTVNDITEERTSRIKAVSGIVKATCTDNNNQDAVLAKLIAVSLHGPSFGSEIDPSQLTPFDTRVLSSIAKVTAMTQETQQQRVFARKLHDLRQRRDCPVIVRAYIAGVSPPASALNGHQDK